MKQHRGLLIYAGLLVTLGVASAALWIALTGTFRPAWWWIAVGSVLITVVADRAEQAITRRLTRPKRVRRRAHARKRATSRPLARSANQHVTPPRGAA